MIYFDFRYRATKGTLLTDGSVDDRWQYTMEETDMGGTPGAQHVWEYSVPNARVDGQVQMVKFVTFFCGYDIVGYFDVAFKVIAFMMYDVKIM